MSAHEALQFALGRLIPVYLTGHALGHRLVPPLLRPGGQLQLLPDSGSGRWRRLADHLVLVVWLHGTIGLHYWFVCGRATAGLQPWLLMAATLLPVLALAGFVSAGREVAAIRALDPVAWAEMAGRQHWPTEDVREALGRRPRALDRPRLFGLAASGCWAACASAGFGCAGTISASPTLAVARSASRADSPSWRPAA